MHSAAASRCDVMPFYPGELRPTQDGHACELGPVVAGAPNNEVSAINAMHSRVKSSTTARMRNRRLSVSVSLTKSSDQRWFGAAPLQPRCGTRRHYGAVEVLKNPYQTSHGRISVVSCMRARAAFA